MEKDQICQKAVWNKKARPGIAFLHSWFNFTARSSDDAAARAGGSRQGRLGYRRNPLEMRPLLICLLSTGSICWAPRGLLTRRRLMDAPAKALTCCCHATFDLFRKVLVVFLGGVCTRWSVSRGRFEYFENKSDTPLNT